MSSDGRRTKSQGQVLLIDDEADQCEIFRRFLADLPVDVRIAHETAEAIELLAAERFQAVLCDLVMPGGGGQKVLSFVQSQDAPVPVIIVTGYGDELTADECLTSGAFDFISKPVDRLSLVAVVRRALLRSGLALLGREAGLSAFRTPDAPRNGSHLPGKERRESAALPRPPGFGLVADSPAMLDTLSRAAKVAETDANLCIYGESGTGKELVARAIHYAGRRAEHPLVVFDCAAIPEGLMESEMFGHVKGSFTSAVSDREGVFELADKGTLLLDEVGELSLVMQAKLLRVIQCREFRKVGGKHPIKVDVRIIAATNRDLRRMVQEQKFREDLFYRLEVVSLTLPALRARKEDIPLLVEHFIQKFNRNNKKQIKGISPRTLKALMAHDWPGNVRELENCIERWAVMSDGSWLEIFDPDQMILATAARASASASLRIPWPINLREAERELILRTLQHVKGNRRQAAELLGISERCLYYKLKELRPEFSGEDPAILFAGETGS